MARVQVCRVDVPFPADYVPSPLLRDVSYPEHLYYSITRRNVVPLAPVIMHEDHSTYMQALYSATLSRLSHNTDLFVRVWVLYTLYTLYFTQSPPLHHPKERIQLPQNVWSSFCQSRSLFASMRHTTHPHAALTRMLAEECFVFSAAFLDTGSSALDAVLPDLRGAGHIPSSRRSELRISAIENYEHPTPLSQVPERMGMGNAIVPVENEMSYYSDSRHPYDGLDTLYRLPDQARLAPRDTRRLMAPVALAAAPPPLPVTSDTSFSETLGPRAHEVPVILRQNRAGLAVALRKRALQYTDAIAALSKSLGNKGGLAGTPEEMKTSEQRDDENNSSFLQSLSSPFVSPTPPLFDPRDFVAQKGKHEVEFETRQAQKKAEKEAEEKAKKDALKAQHQILQIQKKAVEKREKMADNEDDAAGDIVINSIETRESLELDENEGQGHGAEEGNEKDADAKENTMERKAAQELDEHTLWRRICFPLGVRVESAVSRLVESLESCERETASNVRSLLRAELRPQQGLSSGAPSGGNRHGSFSQNGSELRPTTRAARAAKSALVAHARTLSQNQAKTSVSLDSASRSEKASMNDSKNQAVRDVSTNAMRLMRTVNDLTRVVNATSRLRPLSARLERNAESQDLHSTGMQMAASYHDIDKISNEKEDNEKIKNNLDHSINVFGDVMDDVRDTKDAKKTQDIEPKPLVKRDDSEDYLQDMFDEDEENSDGDEAEIGRNSQRKMQTKKTPTKPVPRVTSEGTAGRKSRSAIEDGDFDFDDLFGLIPALALAQKKKNALPRRTTRKRSGKEDTKYDDLYDI